MTATTRQPVTARQREIYDWIVARYAETRCGIGMRELSAAMGCTSPSAMYSGLRTLEKRGYITRTPGRANSILPIAEDATDGD
jgi:repressor LexA